ncbi:MAG: carboxypeptidase regulatory-like domain-containing protein [Acidobacteriia bacterium]|nr:carboxypeptidase regulatory-like domain-containing protein [Terriglobia bacterium]
MRTLSFCRKLRGLFSAILTVTILTVLAALLAAPHAQAQITGTLTGTVTDQVGAAIPKANVTLVNQATNDTRHTVSNGVGYFSFSGLVPSVYTLKVEMANFKTWQHAEITINPGDVRNISDIKMEIGAATEVVSVEAVAGEVKPVDSGERSSVITSKDLDRIAFQGRNVGELIKILPGVTSTGGNFANANQFNYLNAGSQGSAVGNGLNANGAPNRGGTALISDGVNIIDPGCNCWSIATVNPDMTQEVKVQTSNFGADNPHGPVVINNISKSGTSAYHGQAYLYARHNVLNANDWQDNRTKTPKGPDHYYYPGGQIGGPVPGTKNKVLFWGAYEHLLQNTGNAGALTSSIPTSDMLSGNFTPTTANLAVCPDGFSSTATNWCNNLAGTHLPDGTVVPDNGAAGYQIPSQFLDPGSAALAKVFPTTGILTDPTAIAANGGMNYKGVFPAVHNGYIWRARGDYNFSDNTKVFVSWQYGNDNQLASGNGSHMWWVPGNAIPFPGGGLQSPSYSKTLTGHFLHVFSPTMTNEFIAAWGWGNAPISTNVGAISRANLGYTYPTLFASNSNIKMVPSFDCGYCGPNQLPDFSQADVFETGGQFFVRSEMPSFSDNFTKVIKTHTLKVGAFYERVGKFQGNYNFPNGHINNWSGLRNNLFTGDPLGSPNNRVANFAMGIAQGYEEENRQPSNDIAYKTISAYINDNWKVTKRLTLELGVRFEHIGHWYDRTGVGVAVFLPDLVNSDFAAGKMFPGLRWHANDPGVPVSGEPDRFAHVSPRFGIAWDIFGTGKTVVRGGWGAYRWNDQYNDFTAALSPGQGISAYNLPNGSSALLSQISQAAVPVAQWAPSQVGALSATDYNIPVTNSYNLTISHELPGKSLLEIAYVGNSTKHTLMGGGSGASTGSGDFIDLNKAPLGAFFGADPLTGVVAQNPEDVTKQLDGKATGNINADYHAFGVYLGPGALHGQQIYGTQHINVPVHVGYANYNALQLSWVKQTGRLTYNLSYVWSKTLGTVLNIDPYNLHGNYGVTQVDRPQVISAAYAYDLPKFTHGSKVLEGITNGWMISGTTTWQTGTNLQVANNANGPNFGLGLQYDPDTIPAGLSSNVSLGPRTYFGTDSSIVVMPALTCNPGSGLASNQRAKLSCFTAPDFQTQGVRNYPYLHGPIFFDSDLSLSKNFHITERHAVEFRFSAFNWLNHPLRQFSGGNQLQLLYIMDYNTHAIRLNPQVNSQAPNWGYLDFKNGYPGGRIMEMSVKYTF